MFYITNHIYSSPWSPVLINFIFSDYTYLISCFTPALFRQGGLYILSLMDTYSASWSPVVIGFMLCVVLAWVYKVDNFAANLKVMLGKDIGRIQKFMWKFITPLVLMVSNKFKICPPEGSHLSCKLCNFLIVSTGCYGLRMGAPPLQCVETLPVPL